MKLRLHFGLATIILVLAILLASGATTNLIAIGSTVTITNSPITPQILNYGILNQSSKINMPANGSIYFYTGATGGGVSVTNENFNVVNYAINGNGATSVATGYSSNDLGEYNPNNAAYYSIAGISVGSTSGVNSKIIFNEFAFSNSSYGASFVNGSFEVNSSNSLVVIIGAASSDNNPTLSGNFSIKVLDQLSYVDSIIQAYSILSAGKYSINLDSTSTGGNPNGCAVILEVYVIPPAQFYIPQKYSVTFNELGLPTGTSWTVTLGNTTLNSTANNITFNEYNGTYKYFISSASKLSPSPGSGYLTVSGSPVQVSVYFKPPNTYIANFIPLNIPSNTVWWVIIGNQNKSSSGTGNIAFELSNGTYNYSIGTMARYITIPSKGNFVISGSNVNVTVNFELRPYNLKIIERGLPTGYTWTISINGSQYSSSNQTISILVPDGKYLIHVYSLTGYKPYSSNITVLVDNSNKTIYVDYQFISPANISIYYSPLTMVFTSLIILIALAFVIQRIYRGGKGE